MKKYIIILGLTLVMSSHSAFGMTDESKEAKKADAKQPLAVVPPHESDYLRLGAAYLNAHLQAIANAFGPNVEIDGFFPAFVETCQKDMQECVKLCNRGIEICQATIQKCTDENLLSKLAGDTESMVHAYDRGKDISRQASETFPKKLQRFIVAQGEASFGFFAGKAISHIEELTFQKQGLRETQHGTEKYFFKQTIYPFPVYEQLLFIQQAKKLAAVVVQLLSQNRTTWFDFNAMS